MQEDDIDQAVLQALTRLGRSTWSAIAAEATVIAGHTIHYDRDRQPNIRPALDRLEAAGLCRWSGYLAGKAAVELAPASTAARRRQADDDREI